MIPKTTPSLSSPSSNEGKSTPKTLKQKIIYSVVGILSICLISSIMFGNSYYAKEKVEQRFIKALQDKKIAKLESMIIHEDDSTVDEPEVKALLKYVKEYGISAIKGEVKVKPSGSILGVVNKNKISFSDYYAQIVDGPKGLAFTFDQKSFPKTRADEKTVQYGPLIPGIYNVKATLNNEFGKSSKKFNITIQDSNVSMDNHINFFNDSLEIYGFYSNTMKNAKIEANGQRISVDNDGYTDVIGPVISGSKLDLQFSATMPWGERTSNLLLEDDSNIVYPAITNDSDNKEIEKTVTQFFEQRMQYLAQEKATVLTTTTNDLKSDIIEDSLYRGGSFAGKVNTIYFNTSQISINDEVENSIDIHTKVDAEYGYSDYDAVEQLDPHTDYYLLTLTYNPSNKKWLVSDLIDEEASDEKMSGVMEGKKKVYKPITRLENMGDLKNASNDQLVASFETILSNAYSNYVYAVNNNDFDSITDLYIKNGPSYKETKKAIPTYYDKGIQEEFLSVSVKDVQLDDDTATVTSEDQYVIDNPEKGKKVQTFHTKTILKYSDNGWKLYKLISTTLTNSENY